MIFSVMVCLSGIFAPTPETGCLSGNCINGEGVFLFASGARYEGVFLLGKRQGQGTLILSNGVTYQGRFDRDFREGKGRQTEPDGSVYTGLFHRDRFHGNGTMVYADGSIYRGEWDSGKRHGQGLFVDQKGQRVEGKWLNDAYQRDSKMNVDMATSSVLSAPRKEKETVEVQIESTPSAPGLRYTYQDGSIFEGTQVNGLPEGSGTCRYINGNQYTGGWSRHAPHGEGTLMMTDGRRLQGRWVYGRLHKLTAPTQQIDKIEVQPVSDDRIRIWAVVAGVAPYQHMPTLDYPDDDAYQMFAFLRSPEGGALPDNQIRLLINEDATRVNLVEAIQTMFGQADENDVVLFYFSGHGLDGAILPSDFDGFDNRLFYSELTSLLDASHARQKLVITDACFSGSLLAAKGHCDHIEDQLYIELEKSSGGTAILMSSQQEEYSLEDKGLRAGVFSYYLRQGLKGQADHDGDSVVRIDELFTFVKSKVRDRTKQRQTPVLKGTYDENMPLAYLRPRG